jgi:hypothetical protein
VSQIKVTAHAQNTRRMAQQENTSSSHFKQRLWARLQSCTASIPSQLKTRGKRKPGHIMFICTSYATRVEPSGALMNARSSLHLKTSLHNSNCRSGSHPELHTPPNAGP